MFARSGLGCALLPWIAGCCLSSAAAAQSTVGPTLDELERELAALEAEYASRLARLEREMNARASWLPVGIG